MAAESKRLQGVYGPGTFTDHEFTPVPKDSERIFRHLAQITPGFTKDETLLGKVQFRGEDLPILPGPIKSQAFSAACHALIGVVCSEICASKGIDTGTIHIDTDQAGMYPAVPGLVTIAGKNFEELAEEGVPTSVGVNLDHGVLSKTPMRYRTWALYPTKDPHVYYQILGNLDPVGFLHAFGLDPDAASSKDEAYEIIKAEISKYSARELDQKCMEHGFCGQTCYTPEQWRQTMMGKELGKHPLVNYKRVAGLPDTPPVPFPEGQDSRPLAGIKIVELSRIIAAPAMGMILASLGAELIRVEPPHLHDLQPLSLSLTAGKHTCGLNLNIEKDKKHLESLFEEADVVIQAFRLGSLGRRGFGLEHALDIAKRRGKGIVYADLNCYGPDGYYAERPGYQQCADAASGCSYVCGKAYGFEDGVSVLPSLPIADMVCGAVGALEVLLALRDRAKYGGSYHSCAALTSVDTFQVEPEVGLYPPEVVKKIQDKYNFGKMTPNLMVEELLGVVVAAWAKTTNLLGREEFFSTFQESPFGKNHKILAPMTKFKNEAANPFWEHGPVPFCWEQNPQFTKA